MVGFFHFLYIIHLISGDPGIQGDTGSRGFPGKF